MPHYEGELRAPEAARFAIIASRWNPRITDALVTGARQSLAGNGVADTAVDVIRVPGAWEIPVAAARIAAASRHAAIIALGCVIRGDTRHYEHVADRCAEGLMGCRWISAPVRTRMAVERTRLRGRAAAARQQGARQPRWLPSRWRTAEAIGMKPESRKAATSAWRRSVTRARARRRAPQAYYAWQISGGLVEQVIAQFAHEQAHEIADLEYFDDLVRGVLKHRTSLDEALVGYLDRAVEEVDPIERAVLRLSAYELIHRLDVPYRVVINEAIEIAKRFGSGRPHLRQWSARQAAADWRPADSGRP